MAGLDGLLSELELLLDRLQAPLQSPGATGGWPRAVILRGPAGVGKAAAVRCVAERRSLRVAELTAEQLLHERGFGAAEERLGATVAALQKDAVASGRPSVLLLRHLEAICPNQRTFLHSEHPLLSARQADRIVAKLAALIDQLVTTASHHHHGGQVFIVATCHNANEVEPKLRRPGRFDREWLVPPPDIPARRAILDWYTRALALPERAATLQHWAERCVGFVGHDLEQMCRALATRALTMAPATASASETLPIDLAMIEVVLHEAHRKLPFRRTDLGLVDRPHVAWSAIAGHEAVKQELRDTLVLPQQLPELYRRFHLPARAGILLYGPPGTGKTLLARACASESKVAFIAATSASIYSPFVGGAEAAIRQYFTAARAAAPCILFFDEIEAVVGRRSSGHSDGNGVQERVLATMLNEIDGIEESPGVILLAATNRLDMIDEALLRPGRFDKCLAVGPPDAAGLQQLWELYAAQRIPLAADVTIAALVERSQGLTGAHIENICREAALQALRDDITAPTVQLRHFWAAFEAVGRHNDAA